MKINSMNIRFIIIVSSLIALIIISLSSVVCAGTLYHCLDKDGNESILDFPMDGQTCKPLQTYEDMKSVQKSDKAIPSDDDKITKITVIKNQVLVPVTLIYGGQEVEVNLLMDTGASATTIHEDVADRLYISLSKARKTKAQVVGGGIIEASVVQMDAVKIGPHVLKNKYIAVVPHEGPAAKFDGLLGMDVLGAFSHKIDLNQQVIIWE